MCDYSLLIDLHLEGQRQGPGSDAVTELAVQLAGLDRSRPLAIADIGSGTGASALLLARLLDAQITAVDLLPEFLDELKRRATGLGVAEQIETVTCSMDELPFADAQFDVIWSEGAVYNIGFERGITAWRRFLKPGGLLAVSEISWTTGSRPVEIERHWEGEYPEIAPASAKIAVLERQGYAPVGFFPLPAACWLEGYYRPIQERFTDFLARHGESEAAQAIVAAEQQEIALYERYQDFYSYGMYLARRTDG
jgi:SAM-dependent methyltransferase